MSSGVRRLIKIARTLRRHSRKGRHIARATIGTKAEKVLSGFDLRFFTSQPSEGDAIIELGELVVEAWTSKSLDIAR